MPKHEKILVCLVALFVCFGFAAKAETPFYVKKDGKEGYINEKGEIVIPFINPAFWIEKSYSEGLVLAESARGCFVFYDENGKEKLNLGRRYLLVRGFKDGLAYVEAKPYTFGFIDKEGKEVVKPVIKATSGFHSNGRIIIYRSARDKSAREIDDIEVVDLSGKTIVPKGKYDWLFPYHEGVAMVGKNLPQINRAARGAINLNGEIIIPLEYDLIFDASGGVLWAAKSNLWTTFDTNGIKLFQVKTANFRPFSEGLACVQDWETKLYGYVDRSGKWAIKPTYKRCGDFVQGWAAVDMEDEKPQPPQQEQGLFKMVPMSEEFKIGFIDKTGKLALGPLVIPKTKEEMLSIDKPYLPRCQGSLIRWEISGKIGYMDRNGKWIWPLQN